MVWVSFLFLNFFQPCCEAMAAELPCHHQQHSGIMKLHHYAGLGQSEHAICVKFEIANAAVSQFDGKALQRSVAPDLPGIIVDSRGFEFLAITYDSPKPLAFTSSSDQALYLTTLRLRI